MKTSDVMIECNGFFMRTLYPEDVTPAYVDWMNDIEIVQHTESRAGDYSLADITDYVARWNNNDSVVFLGLFLQEDGRHVGNIKLGPIDHNARTGDIGIIIGDTRVWGRGMASEAIFRLSEWAFVDLGLRKVTAGAHEANIGSIKAFQKSGFTVDRIETVECKTDDKPIKVLRMSKANVEIA